MSATMLNLLADAGGSFWMPPQGSDMAGDVDWLFFFIFYICLFFFLLILVLLVTFAWKYRYREGAPMLDAPKHNTAAELTWTFIPTLIVIVIFFYGFKGYLRMVVPPPDSYEVDVTAQMWRYNFNYPNGQLSDDMYTEPGISTQIPVMHIPVDTPVVFVLTSTDVIHGFYMPVFRIKKDVVPGRYNKIWVQATTTGMFDIYCTQYCGQDHSSMRAKVLVQPRADFVAWVNKLGGGNFKTPADRGKYLWQTRGCNTCHTIDGTDSGKAPTWKDLYMETQQTLSGPHLADENYLHTVITRPNIYPFAKYNPVMPPTQGLLDDKDISDIISFIKTLSKNYHQELPTATTAPSAAAAGPATEPAK
jgi:cytochrome c oxidase subunit 2